MRPEWFDPTACTTRKRYAHEREWLTTMIKTYRFYIFAGWPKRDAIRNTISDLLGVSW